MLQEWFECLIDEAVARSEDGKIDYSDFVSWAEGLVQGKNEEAKMKEEDLKKLFDLLDRDEDDYLEFSDVLALFSQWRLSCQMKRRESDLSGFMTGMLALDKA